jgi:hypothetical protein
MNQDKQDSTNLDEVYITKVSNVFLFKIFMIKWNKIRLSLNFLFLIFN